MSLCHVHACVAFCVLTAVFPLVSIRVVRAEGSVSVDLLYFLFYSLSISILLSISMGGVEAG